MASNNAVVWYASPVARRLQSNRRARVQRPTPQTLGHERRMIRLCQILCSLLCLVASVHAQVKSPVKIDLSTDRREFDDPDAPVTLFLKFTNVSTNEFAICPNRIECQNTVKTVVNKPGDKPVSIDTNWWLIPQHIADYYHGDKEQYVLLKPGESYTREENYFTGKDMRVKHLLGFAGDPWPPEDGIYILRIYFSGEACPVFNAPPAIADRLLKAKVISNEIEITLKRK